MIKEVDLLAYLPPLIQEYYEMRKIMEAENPEFQMIWDANELIRLNLFILTATEQGLRRFEKIVGIFPSPQDTFESRRLRILTRWNDTLPYTFRYLEGIISVMTDGNFTINTSFPEYYMEIITHIGQFGIVDNLAHFLQMVIPANIDLNSLNILDVTASGALRIASTSVSTVVYMVTNDFEATYGAQGMAASASTLIQTRIELITNDFEATYAASGQGNVGSNAAVIPEYLITNDFDGTVQVNGSAVNAGAIVTVTEYQI